MLVLKDTVWSSHLEFLDLKKPAANAETNRLQVTKLYLELGSSSRGLRG